jgi:hypothetical protein
MNDEQYVEASRKLAARMLTEGGAAPAEQLAFGFRLVASRQPASDEAEVLIQSYQAHLGHYQKHPEEAARLLAVGEAPRQPTLDPPQHAAMTMVANLLLNLDETVTKE